jgi:tripartite ATP-independent transporter DctM subunit
MGIIALPSMLKRGYSKQIALGSIVAAAPLGVIIPPSVLIIVYGAFSNTSVGQLLAAGFVTGFIIAVFFIIYILIIAYFKPHLCPAIPKEDRSTWKEKWQGLAYLVLPIALVLMVFGSIITGTATPTEAAGVGCLGALICSAVRGRLKWNVIKQATTGTIRLSSMIGWLAFVATAYSSVFFGVGGRKMVQEFLLLMPGGALGAIVVTFVIIFIMGMFVDATLIVVLCAPMFVPILQSMGVNIVWYGILFCIMTELGYFTPPFGFSIYILKSVAPKDVTIGDVYKSTWPFVGVQVVAVAFLIAFPAISLWLPNLMLSMR